MAGPLKQRWPLFLYWGLGLSLGAALLALIIAYSGIFNIAASAGHPHWLNWFLTLGKRRSIIVNSRPVIAPELNLADLIPLGAAHFEKGCATCHGTPGQGIAPVYNHMLPPPSELKTVVPTWQREQLFWIVRHGIQFTGMPAWSGDKRDDEVWAVVAFLEVLPFMKTEDYRQHLRSNEESLPKLAGEPLPQENPELTRIGTCNHCHDNGDTPPSSSYIPHLSGQNKAYLVRSLHEYRGNHRQSGFMEPFADGLDDELINRLANHYEATVPVSRPAPDQSLEWRGSGRQLAEQGDSRRKIPACRACHGENKRQDYPHLAGQSKNYLKQQLQLWRRGGRVQTPHGVLMGTIAKRMSEQQVAAAAEFFSSLSPAEYSASSREQ